MILITASLHGINLRAGGFCNPGAVTKALKLSLADIQRHHFLYSRKCGDNQDIIEGRPTGALRISFGLCNTVNDVERWITFLKTFFVPDDQLVLDLEIDRPITGRLLSITVFPVKSCGGYSTDAWNISDSGLSLDRHWMLVDENGKTLTQKTCPNMALVRPVNINLYNNTVELESLWCPSTIVLKRDHNDKSSCAELCGERYNSRI